MKSNYIILICLFISTFAFGQDSDGDNVVNALDNCTFIPNASQYDLDNDGNGDPCDTDIDGDGVLNSEDNCPTTANPNQVDSDGDGIGNVCDPTPYTTNNPDRECFSTFYLKANFSISSIEDFDGNIVALNYPYSQSELVNLKNDLENQGFNLILEPGSPSSGEVIPLYSNLEDGLPFLYKIITNNEQSIANLRCVTAIVDTDGDGQIDEHEIECGSDPENASSVSTDTDGDSIPDCVDLDDDNDGQTDSDEIACGSDPLNSNSTSSDIDGDGIPDCVDTDGDTDGDGVDDAIDNCPFEPNSDQSDIDGDGIGDVCDFDSDGDGVENSEDNCPTVSNPYQIDSDGDGQGDACEVNEDVDCYFRYEFGLQYQINELIINGVQVGSTNNLGFRSGDPISNLITDVNNAVGSPGDHIFFVNGYNSNSVSPSNPIVMIFPMESIDSIELVLDDNDVNDPRYNFSKLCLSDNLDTDGDGQIDIEEFECTSSFPDPASIGNPWSNTSICDSDGDTIGDSEDNCPNDANTNQLDTDSDGIGDVCDPMNGTDNDGDGILNSVDNCPTTSNFNQIDTNNNGVGDACDSLQESGCYAIYTFDSYWEINSFLINNTDAIGSDFGSGFSVSAFENEVSSNGFNVVVLNGYNNTPTPANPVSIINALNFLDRI